MSRLFETATSDRWLFCLTHPDDELAVAAWIKRLTGQGVEVSMSWTHSKPVREQEARSVAKLLGVPDDHLHFFNGPDGTICREIETLLPRFKALLDQIQPTKVVTCAFEQGHLDHDSTNFMVNHASQVPVLEFPLYHPYTSRLQTLGHFSNCVGADSLSLTQEEQVFKKRIAKMYPSTNIWSVLLWYEAGCRLTFRSSGLLDQEHLRVCTGHDWRSPNHDEKLASKIKKSAKWQVWKQAMEELERSGLTAPSIESSRASDCLNAEIKA